MTLTRGCLLLVLLCGRPGAAEAQRAGIWVDPVGVPISVLDTPSLARGWYQVETYDLHPEVTSLFADSVIAVRTGSTLRDSTIAGADECPISTDPVEGMLRRSCARFQVAGEARQVWVWMWAWRVVTAGRASLRIQRLDDAEAVPANTACADEGRGVLPERRAVRRGCWTTVADQAPFGGMSIQAADLGAAPDGPIRLETTEQPGAELSASSIGSVHAILFARQRPGELRADWDLTTDPAAPWPPLPFPGSPGSHPSAVAQTAMWAGQGSWMGLEPLSGTVIAGPFLLADAGGPFRLLRNDRVEDPRPGRIAPSGVDQDADGLGEELEALLHTCDSVASPDGLDGAACSARPGCDGSDDDLCRAALRDSDGDGLRDNHELYGAGYYGVDSGGRRLRTPGMELARFGADPARVDIMLEVDQLGDWDSSAPPRSRCRMPATQLLSAQGARHVARIWRNVEITNRNGQRGVFVHLDVGFAPELPVDLGVFGDWGGSTAVCLQQGPAQDNLAPQRTWLFRHAHYRDLGGGGNASVPSWHIDANAPYALAHELGHTTGIEHWGPRGTAGANGNVFYVSRANYLYEAWGNVGRTPTDPAIDEISFSRGKFQPLLGPGGFNPWQASEACPFGRGTDLPAFLQDQLRRGGTDLAHPIVQYNASSTCWEVDWNRDGAITPITGVVQARVIRSSQHLMRRTRIGWSELTRTAGDLVIAGDVAVQALIRAERFEPPVFGERPRRLCPGDLGGLGYGSPIYDYRLEPFLRIMGAIECDECAASYETGCWNLPEAEVPLLGEGQEPIEDARAMAAAAVTPTSSGAVVLYVLLRSDLELEWGTYDVVAGIQRHGGAVPAPAGVPLPSLKLYEEMIALTETNVPGEALLAYRAEDGSVYTQRARMAAPSTVFWDPPTLVGGANAPVAAPGTAVGLARVDMPARGVLLAVGEETPGTRVFDRLTLLFRPDGGTEWSRLASIRTTLQSRPSVEQVDYPSGRRLVASWIASDGIARYAESQPGSASVWQAERPCTPATAGADCDLGVCDAERFCEEAVHVNGSGGVVMYPIPLAWDDRPSAGFRGLRAVYSEREQCAGDRRCPFDACCTGTARCASPDANDLDLPRFGKELLVPYFDGVVPMRLNDFDDRGRIVHDICEVVRECEVYHDVPGGWGGCPREDDDVRDYVELDPMDPSRAYGSALCTPVPPQSQATMCFPMPPTPMD